MKWSRIVELMFYGLAAGALLIGLSGLVGRIVLSFTADDSPTVACQSAPSPLEARAEADARDWLRGHVSVLRLQRNAVVFNWTVVPRGKRPQPGWQFSEWYVRQPDGTLKYGGTQRLSGLGS